MNTAANISEANETLISDVMTKLPHTVGSEQPAQVAREMMAKYNVKHLPVQEGGELVGIISDRDINFALAVDLKKDSELSVSEIYTAEPVKVGPKTKLVNVLKKMDQDKIGCILVEEKNTLIGIYTLTDVCRDFCSVLETGSIPAGGA